MNLGTKDVHIMLDLETMGNSSSAAILSLGLVAFETTESEGPQFIYDLEIAVSLASSVEHGGTLDPSTVLWWMQPEREAARSAYLEYKHPLSIVAALNEVSHFIGDFSAIKPLPLIWGNGVDFDNTILASAYRNAGITVPWGFRQNRCFRTLKSVYAGRVPEPEFLGTSHSAIDDARHQARWLNRILQEIK